MQTQLIAKADLYYAGRNFKAGDEFTATEQDAKVLEIIGKAEKAKPKRQYLRRDMQAEQ